MVAGILALSQAPARLLILAHGQANQLSSVLNPAAAEEKYQVPSAKASAELVQHERFLPQEALKRESLPRRFRVASAD